MPRSPHLGLRAPPGQNLRPFELCAQPATGATTRRVLARSQGAPFLRPGAPRPQARSQEQSEAKAGAAYTKGSQVPSPRLKLRAPVSRKLVPRRLAGPQRGSQASWQVRLLRQVHVLQVLVEEAQVHLLPEAQAEVAVPEEEPASRRAAWRPPPGRSRAACARHPARRASWRCPPGRRRARSCALRRRPPAATGSHGGRTAGCCRPRSGDESWPRRVVGAGASPRPESAARRRRGRSRPWWGDRRAGTD